MSKFFRKRDELIINKYEIFRKIYCKLPTSTIINFKKLFLQLPISLKNKFKIVSISLRKVFSVDLELTNACNANCIMCPRHLIKQIGFMEDITFKKIILKLKKDRIRNVLFCGLGEPLLHPKIVEFVDYSIKNHIEPNLVTNGLLLDRNMQDKLIKKGLKHFTLSIPSINKKIFEKINRGINYENVMNNLSELIKHKKIHIKINIAVSKLNEDYIEELIQFCKTNNIELSFLNLTNRGIQDFNKNLKTYMPYKKRMKYIKIKNICPVSSLLTYISYDGGVYLCCNDVKREHKICNYLSYPFYKILDLKRIYFKQSIEICNICQEVWRI